MGAFLVYLFELSIFALALYSLNKLLLSKDTLHTLNRVLWLGTIAVSAILPFVIAPFKSLVQVAPVNSIGNVEVGDLKIVSIQSSNLSFDWRIVFYIYITGAIICAILLIYRYINLFYLLRTSAQSSHPLLEECKLLTGHKRSIKLIVNDEEIAPFSWMNYIVVSKQDINKEVLFHELTHSKLWHSLDIIFADLFIILQWFNPAAWLIKSSIQQVHEYQADNAVLNAGTNVKNYQLLLIRKAVGQRLYTMANSFNHSNLKNRITMMSKSKSSKWAVAKCLVALPMSIALLTAFTTPAISNSLEQIQTKDSKNSKKSSESKPIVILDGKIFKGDMNTIPVDSIESMTVLKGDKAVEKYGPDAKSGAIEITLKKGNLSIETSATKSQEELQVVGTAALKNETIPAQFQGSDASAFATWAMNNLKYPKSAKIDGFECTVLVKYTVKADGSVADVSALRVNSKHKNDYPQAILDCTDEAIRVVKSSPKWTPCKDANGNAANMIFTIPIRFTK